MAGRRPAIADQEPRFGGVRVSASGYGITIPIVYGRTRVPMHLIGHWGFRATRREEAAEAGKGGSRPGRANYEYSASVAMLIGEGPISAVRRVFRGKSEFDGNATSAQTLAKRHTAVVPGSPHAITVPSPSEWASTVRVIVPDTDPTDWPPYDLVLVEGVDFTVAAGVYTFAAGRAGLTVEIEYIANVAATSADALGELGLALARGTPTQPVWQYLATNFPAEAVAYPAIAYARGQDYPLSQGAEVENHTVEVDGLLMANANGDARPADVIEDLCASPQYGVGAPSSLWGDLARYRAYCEAANLWISPALTEQRPAREWIAQILDATNADAVFDGRAIGILPRGDSAIGGYTPDLTPEFDLGVGDFLAGNGPAVTWEQGDPGDVPNLVRVEYADRERGYAITPTEAKNEAAILEMGSRTARTYTWHFLCDPTVARTAAQIRRQRDEATLRRAKFRLPWRFLEVGLGTIVRLTYAPLGLSLWPAMVVDIVEADDDESRIVYEVTVEEFPAGHGVALAAPAQTVSGFRPDRNAPPGNVTAPRFFEPPGGFTPSGLEVWAAVSGPAGAEGALWGGCDVWASLDGGVSYKRVARVDQGARYGTLSATMGTAAGATAEVALAGRGGQLRSVSAAEANAHTTLAFVGDTASGEWIAFELATLTGTNAYSLAGLRRGLYGTTAASRASGSAFVYIDGAIAMSGPLPEEMIGREIRFKFCSFNVFGGGLQRLEDVVEYSYTLTGRFRAEQVVPLSANLLPGSDFAAGVPPGWTVRDVGVAAGATTVTQHESAALRVPGTPSSIHIAVASAETGSGRAGVLVSPPVAVIEGEVYRAFGDFIGWETDGHVGLEWCDANGVVLPAPGSQLAGGLIGARAANAVDGQWNNPNHYGRSTLQARAPTGARTARWLAVATFGWTAAATKLLSVHRPFLGEVPPATRDDPPYSAGPNGRVGTRQLAPGAATDVAGGPLEQVFAWNGARDLVIAGPTVTAPHPGTLIVRASGTLQVTQHPTERIVYTATLTPSGGDPKSVDEQIVLRTLSAGGETDLHHWSVESRVPLTAGQTVNVQLLLSRWGVQSLTGTGLQTKGVTALNATDRTYNVVLGTELIKA